MNSTEVHTKNSIGLLIEKVINFDENIPEPLINYNEKCFYQNAFQSILQMLFECCDIRQYFIDYFTKDNTNETDPRNLNFKELLGKLFHYMREMNEKEIQNAVETLNRFYENSINKDDIHKSYLQILNKINEEHKLSQDNHSEFDKETNISDRFYGRISYETRCSNEVCNKVFNKTCQFCASLPLIIPSIEQNIPISECIETHFEISKVDGAEFQCCATQKIISISQLTQSPQFLFLYLVRVSNNNAFIEFDNYINIPTVNENVLYKLRSVIDRCHEHKYLVKMLLKSTWWLKKDCRFQMVNPKNVPTQFTIGLLFEKVTNINHNIPEPLFIDKYNSNCQNYLESIVKFLYLCIDIRKHLICFYTNKDTSDNITENLIFKKKIGEMMVLLGEKETGEIKMLLRKTLNFLPTKIYDFRQLYCCIMDILNDKINNINTDAKQKSSMPEPDLFGGEISIDLKCKLCEKIFIEGIKTFKSITIQEPIYKEVVLIDECIQNFLNKSQNNESSDKQQIISVNQLTNPPQFIFIYLVRKFGNFIAFNNYINISTVNGDVLYKLRYVIDKIVYNQSIDYVVITLSDSNWLRKNGYEVKKINPTDVPTNYSVGLLIEKVTNINHQVPETLINHNYLYKGALQSIIQMLYECLYIRKYLIDFYTSDHSNENITESLIFKRKIGEIMYFLKDKKEFCRITELTREALNFLPNETNKIHELYNCLMNKLNNKDSVDSGHFDSMDECGYKQSKIRCEKCNFSEEIFHPQFFRSLVVKSENFGISWSKRIENCLKYTLCNNNNSYKCCRSPTFVIVEEILSAPKYLFICFDRIERKIEVDYEIILNTNSGTIIYSLLTLLIKCSNGQTKQIFKIINFEPKSIQKRKNVFESVIAVMMIRNDDSMSRSNPESSYQACAKDMKAKELVGTIIELQNNLMDQQNNVDQSNILDKIDDSKNIDNYSFEKLLNEESLESDFIADSIKQIIELNKDKISALLAMLFSCTLFRNIMIHFHKNNEIKKIFEEFPVANVVKFVNKVCILYDHVVKRKPINPIVKSDNNSSIHQCFNYIFENIKLITNSTEFSKTINFRFSHRVNSNIISDNFYGTFSLETICENCSKSHKFEDSFSNLCVKKPQNNSDVNLETCLIEHGYEINYQQDEKCCENAKMVLLRKIIHAPKILFICVDEQSRNNNPDCILHCDSIINIDTPAGPVTYWLVSILDHNDSNMYDVKFFGNSGWWHTYPRSRKMIDFDIFTKHNVGFLFKKLE